MRYKKPNWAPDWKDKEQYPAPDEMDFQDWAWEFLRRNRKYQLDWQIACENPNKLVFNNNFDDLRTKDEWREGDKSATPIRQAYADMWALLELSPPEFPRKCNMLLNFTTSPRAKNPTNLWTEDGIPNVVMGSPTKESAFSFTVDLEAPINPQVTHIKKFMKSRRQFLIDQGKIVPFTTKVNTRYMTSYLRCFDARQCGAKISEIAEVIFGGVGEYPDYLGNKEVQNALSAADKLVHGGYAKLPAMIKPT